MVETGSWKVSRGISDGEEICRLCGSFRETVHHLLSRCILVGKEYVQCHNKALMVIAIELAKKYSMVQYGTRESGKKEEFLIIAKGNYCGSLNTK